MTTKSRQSIYGASVRAAPVVYMTANDNPAVRVTALQSGCVAYLTKPFSGKR